MTLEHFILEFIWAARIAFDKQNGVSYHSGDIVFNVFLDILRKELKEFNN